MKANAFSLFLLQLLAYDNRHNTFRIDLLMIASNAHSIIVLLKVQNMYNHKKRSNNKASLS